MMRSSNFPVYLLTGLLVIADRLTLLLKFHFNYVGSDDLIFWLGAHDYSLGIFHEPYFYGQKYNFMLEALFAVPLIWTGLDFNIALPLVSSGISLMPFVIWSIALYRNRSYLSAIFFLSIPLLLPLEYGFLGSVSRGFTSGLLFTVFLIPAVLKPNKPLGMFYMWFATFFGFIMNPNSIIVCLPVVTLALLTNYNKPIFYLSALVVSIPAFLIQYLAKMFYEVNPLYKVCSMWKIEFDLDLLLKNLTCLDCFFPYFTPLEWKHGWLGFILVFAVALILIRHDWKIAISMIFGVLLILVSLGVNKVNDDANTILLSSSRMFLGIPIFLGIAWYWTSSFTSPSKPQTKVLFAVLCLTVFFFKTATSDAVLSKLQANIEVGPMPIKPIDALCEECQELKHMSDNTMSNLLVMNPTWHRGVPQKEFYTYGCGLLIDDFPKTLLTIYEKRTWVFIQASCDTFERVIVYDSTFTPEKMDSDSSLTLIDSSFQTVLIDNGRKLDLRTLLESHGIKLKRNGYD